MDASALLRQWSAVPARTRIVAASVGFIIVAVLIAACVAKRPTQTKLFAAALYPEQLTEVQERLAGWNIAFTPLADNVLVDSARRNELLLKLSLAGVPHGHVGTSNDVLAKISAFTPQTVIEEQTRSGLAGDIAVALRGIAGVQDATVIVAPERSGTFADETSSEASASVRLQLRPGAQLTTDMAGGVRSFVAAAVPGLKPESVTILDDTGANATQTAASDQAASLEHSLQTALDAMLGAGAAIVRVRVDLDRRSISSRDVRRAPLSVLPIAASVQDERFAGEGKRYGRSAQQLDRGSDTRESIATTDGPRVARITAAVIVDAARDADLVQIRRISEAALGIDPRRGDSIDVQSAPFSHQREAKKDGWWLAYGAIVPLMPALVFAVVAIVALVCMREPARMVSRAFIERTRVTRTSQAIIGFAPAKVRGALRDEPPHTAAAIISALPAATAAAVLDMYPEHERAAIIRRMQRPTAPIIGDPRDFLADV